MQQKLGLQPAMPSGLAMHHESALDTHDEEQVDTALVQAVLDQMYGPRLLVNHQDENQIRNIFPLPKNVKVNPVKACSGE